MIKLYIYIYYGNHYYKIDEFKLNELYNILKLLSQVFVVEQNYIYQDIDDIDKNSYHFFIKGNNDMIKVYLRILEKDKENCANWPSCYG